MICTVHYGRLRHMKETTISLGKIKPNGVFIFFNPASNLGAFFLGPSRQILTGMIKRWSGVGGEGEGLQG